MFNYRRVHFDVFAFDFQLRQLAVRLRHVSNRAYELPEQRPHRHHARFQHRFLQFGVKRVGQVRRFFQFVEIGTFGIFQQLRDSAASDGDFSGEIQQAIQFGDFYPHCAQRI